MDYVDYGFQTPEEWEAKKQAIRDETLSKQVITEDNYVLDSLGRRWTIQAWTNRAIRTTIANELLDNTLALIEEYDHDLVFSSYLSDSSELCIRYQNRVFSVSGKSSRYKPLEPALWRGGGGLIHPNCRHAIEIYIPELSELEKRDTFKEIREERAVRENYLSIRRNKQKWEKRLKEEVALGINDPKTRNKAREWRGRLKSAPKPNDRAFII